MNYERSDSKNLQDLYDECNNLMGYHITIVMQDGSTVDGMIEKVDSNGIIMLVGEDVMSEDDNMPQADMQRQFGKGDRMRRHRRFRRRGYPFNSIRRVFPIIYPYPFFPFFPY